jgi:ferritin-like metal-binding protein YciE
MAQKLTDARKVFEIKLQSLYDVEKQLERALPKMARAATDPELKESVMAHFKETKEHSGRLEKIFKLLDGKPKKLKSEGIRGIILDGEWVTQTTGDDTLRDAMLASALRYAEHYEMAGYLTACDQASLLDLPEIESLLRETLMEEEAADKKLAGAMRNHIDSSMAEEE